jgi:hypothetical protein
MTPSTLTALVFVALTASVFAGAGATTGAGAGFSSTDEQATTVKIIRHAPIELINWLLSLPIHILLTCREKSFPGARFR